MTTMMTVESDFLSIRDIAERLQCSTKNVAHLERIGAIPGSVKLGRLRRWRRVEWEKFCAASEGGK